MAKKRTLVEDLIGITIAVPIAGASIGFVGSSGLPAPLARGTSSLIGVGLLKGAADIAEKKSRRLFWWQKKHIKNPIRK